MSTLADFLRLLDGRTVGRSIDSCTDAGGVLAHCISVAFADRDDLNQFVRHVVTAEFHAGIPFTIPRPPRTHWVVVDVPHHLLPCMEAITVGR